MKILITGASSYVGAEIYTYLKDKFEVVGTYNSNKLFEELQQLDITHKEDVESVISKANPDYVIHIAAVASGGWCDKNEDLTKDINEKGTENVVEAANNVNAKVIYISSFSAIYPTSLYGKTKLAGEEFVKKAKAGFNILQPSLIMGYSPNTKNDRPFNRLLNNLLEKTPAVYDSSWKFQATYLRHISEIILKIIESNISNQTIPIAVPELTSRFKLAKDILSPFGIEVTEEDQNKETPVYSEDLSKLKELGLPEYSYSEMIENIIQEIKNNFPEPATKE